MNQLLELLYARMCFKSWLKFQQRFQSNIGKTLTQST